MAKKLNINPIDVCEYIYLERCTVRQAAEFFNISKSAVHEYFKRCPDEALKYEVELILSDNKANRHVRGGQATKKRWEALKNG